MLTDPSGFSVRLNDDIIRRYESAKRWSNVTLADHAREAVREQADATLLIDSDKAWTRAEIYLRARQLGSSLRQRGLNYGDVISFQIPNWHEAAIINLAAAIHGFVINPIVPIQRDHEVTFSLTESQSKLIFIPGKFRGYDYAAMMRRVRDGMDNDIDVVVLRANEGDFTRFDDLLQPETGPLPPPANANNVKMVMYTSGTTGRAKGVLHSHNTLMAEIESFQRYWGIDSRDSVLMASPVSHVAGILWALELPWIARTSAVLMDQWSPEVAVQLIERYHCTITSGATVFLQDLLRASETSASSLSSLRLFVCGGAPIPPQAIQRAYATWPTCITVRVYGSTEASSVTYGTLQELDPDHAANTDGKICNWEVKITDPETGKLLSNVEEGEILVRGPELFLGYVNPEENDTAFDEEGFFRTGDVGGIVEGEYLTITDRKKDLIIRGGENISAREIEDVLIAFPGILAVAAVAMPCSRMGEAVCAFVETKNGKIDKEAVAKFMIDAGLARQKIPERLEMIEQLPRTASGKIRKDLLRKVATEFAK